VRRAPRFLETALTGLPRDRVRFVSHRTAHAASAFAMAPWATSAVIVLDGRGERSSYLAGHHVDGTFREVVRVDLPHSLGLRYEELTEHLGFRRSSDESKVMALAAYGESDHLDTFHQLIRTDGRGRFVTEPVDWCRLAPPRRRGARPLRRAGRPGLVGADPAGGGAAGAGHLAARPYRGGGADHGRRRRPQLRGQLGALPFGKAAVSCGREELGHRMQGPRRGG
jgi:hypothetical protein